MPSTPIGQVRTTAGTFPHAGYYRLGQDHSWYFPTCWILQVRLGSSWYFPTCWILQARLGPQLVLSHMLDIIGQLTTTGNSLMLDRLGQFRATAGTFPHAGYYTQVSLGPQLIIPSCWILQVSCSQLVIPTCWILQFGLSQLVIPSCWILQVSLSQLAILSFGQVRLVQDYSWYFPTSWK